MMNLKDAFRAQNKLQAVMDEARAILEDRDNVLKVATTHLRSKVMPDEPDAVLVSAPPSEYADHINEAKASLPIDMDSETGLNRARQTLADTFRRMSALRSSEVIVDGGGSGYRFNSDGNQISYRCGAKRVTTINFNRTRVRGMATELGHKSDEVSAAMDRCLVNTQVDYRLPFEMNDSFDVILSDFIEKQSRE